jgi:SAM-dependent methyltransferase
VGAGVSAEAVIWHDLECGGYRADLRLWRRLAREHGGPVLDIGAGTGRVALVLARAGHHVIAVERDHELAAELGRRAGALPVTVHCADACAYEPASPVPLCIVPMQTLHLLEDRAAFLRCARAALRPGGVLAAALLGTGVEPFALELDPDAVLIDGIRYESAPTGLRRSGGTVLLERRRSRVGAGPPRSEIDRVSLRECSVSELIADAATAGFDLVEVHHVAPTREHAGSDVVCLGVPA